MSARSHQKISGVTPGTCPRQQAGISATGESGTFPGGNAPKRQRITGGNAPKQQNIAGGKRRSSSSQRGYTSVPLSFNRKMVAASASVSHSKNIFHSLAKADVTEPRRKIREYYEKTGEKLSFTAYVVKCLAEVIADHKQLNSFIRRNRLIMLEEVNVSVLVEREFEGENVPEPVCIRNVDQRNFREISSEIREVALRRNGIRDAGQRGSVKKGTLGDLQGMGWIRFIPAFLLRSFVRIADRNIRMAKKYGKVAVTAVGMFSREPVWFLPHGSATVLVTVGSIEKRMINCNGKQEEREYLCITGSFDHDIVDGAPAARFMNQFLETLRSAQHMNF